MIMLFTALHESGYGPLPDMTVRDSDVRIQG